DVPQEARVGAPTLPAAAKGPATEVALPVEVRLATDLPAKLSVSPQLPELRGTSKSTFEFQLGIKNESGKKVTVGLASTVPENWDGSFTEQYGTQELNALPLDHAHSKDVNVKVRPPNTIPAGQCNV